jgi:glucose-6-phosphate 1-dehydrogenase
VFRIDHFLGKETVQNILVARFANSFLSAVWDRDHIDHVQITAAELVDVGTRGSFYDATGALRDMVPNHLMQLLAMTAMEPPNDWGAEATRTEKAKVLSAIRKQSLEEAENNGIRGRYTTGRNGDKDVPAYLDVADVGKESKTETYVALKLMVDTWRWAGVPFYLRTGKALAARDTEVVIQFKPTPYAAFAIPPAKDLPPNRLVLRLQPNEGITLTMEVKQPGPAIETTPVELDFTYADKFKLAGRTGYETLLYDMFVGDPTLFQRADQIEAGWAAVQPFLDGWAKSKDKPEDYAPGSTGPAGADALLERDSRQWHPIA